MSSEINMEEEFMDYLSINVEDSLDLKEKSEESIHMVGMLIAEVEPSQIVVKEVLRSVWRKMGNVKVSKAKPNVYSIQVGDEKTARRILEGNPWFIKGAPVIVKLWPLYQSLDEICANKATFWVQIHGIPRAFCTAKNARMLGGKIGSVLEIEDPIASGFWGFLRIRVDFDATKPLLTSFVMSCPSNGSRTLRLQYEGLKDFCYKCGRLSHVRNCQWKAPISRDGENRYNLSLRALTVSRVPMSLFPERASLPLITSGGDSLWRGRKEGDKYHCVNVGDRDTRPVTNRE